MELQEHQDIQNTACSKAKADADTDPCTELDQAEQEHQLLHVPAELDPHRRACHQDDKPALGTSTQTCMMVWVVRKCCPESGEESADQLPHALRVHGEDVRSSADACMYIQEVCPLLGPADHWSAQTFKNSTKLQRCWPHVVPGYLHSQQSQLCSPGLLSQAALQGCHVQALQHLQHTAVAAQHMLA